MLNPDGSVTASSQIEPDEFAADQEVFGSMLGIVISVKPSDDKGNLSASTAADQRGYRHEATVLIVAAGTNEPNMLLENVVIPPRERSNADDYEEDLPVGVSKVLSGGTLTQNWANIEVSTLDGDFCVVQFLGGNLDSPYISGWWPHPFNRIDPATTGAACLPQFDPTKLRSRKFQRTNGVEKLVTAEGDTYFDTSRAGSKMDFSGATPKRKDVTNGGSVQVDIKSGQQLELNWNAPIEGLKAGSTSKSQTREPQRPHLNHAKAEGAPPARSINDTILRFKKQEATISTGKMVIRCHKDGGGDGFYMATGDDGMVIGQGASGETLASLSMSDGEILISTPDGDNIALSSDKISVTNKSGANVIVDGSSVAVNAAGGVTLGTATGAQPFINATLYNAQEKLLLDTMTALMAALTTLQGEWETAASGPSPWTPTSVSQKAMATALTNVTKQLGIFLAAQTAQVWDTKLVSGV